MYSGTKAVKHSGAAHFLNSTVLARDQSLWDAVVLALFAYATRVVHTFLAFRNVCIL